MSPGNGGGGPGRHPEPPATKTDAATMQPDPEQGNANGRQQPPYVWAATFPPAGRRRYWLLVVQRCAYCAEGNHAHRCGAAGGLRRAGCGRGWYVVLPRPSLGVAA